MLFLVVMQWSGLQERSRTTALNSLRQTIYQGYLSAELTNADKQTLWSYIGNAEPFPHGNIVDDLADRISQKLIEAIKNGILPRDNHAEKKRRR